MILPAPNPVRVEPGAVQGRPVPAWDAPTLIGHSGCPAIDSSMPCCSCPKRDDADAPCQAKKEKANG